MSVGDVRGLRILRFELLPSFFRDQLGEQRHVMLDLRRDHPIVHEPRSSETMQPLALGTSHEEPDAVKFAPVVGCEVVGRKRVSTRTSSRRIPLRDYDYPSVRRHRLDEDDLDLANRTSVARPARCPGAIVHESDAPSSEFVV